MKKELWLRDSECTGCGACANACPKGAIRMELGGGGHIAPVPVEGCVGCGLCERACPALDPVPSCGAAEPEIYAAWAKDEGLRFRSTSGGVFSELARVVLSRGGVAFGAAYGDGLVVRHEAAVDEGGLARLRQSKYVQSEMGTAMREAKRLLESGREVLFCGAPCQVAGLRSYLGGDREGVYLVDFVCRGVNSPKAYRAWLDELERAHGARASRVWFKYKEGGWKSSPMRTRVDFEDGSFDVLESEGNGYMRGYLDSNLYLRPSCAGCSFKGFPRQGDVTVADFWGLDPDLDDDRGASMVMVSTPRGRELFDAAAESLNFHERPFGEIFAGNVCIDASAPLNPRSAEFLEALDGMPFSEAIRRYGRKSIARRIAAKAKRFLEEVVRRAE